MVHPADAELARLAALVYSPFKEVGDQLVDMRWRVKFSPISRGGAEAMLVTRGDINAIVFRGTEATDWSWRDLWANWPWPLLHTDVGWVHPGYWAYLQQIRTLVEEMCQRAPGGPLFAVGHSLGGALAHLFAAESRCVTSAVTFGAPKAGGPDVWDGATMPPVRRYVLPADFAPAWPPMAGLSQPGEAARLTPPRWWPGPCSRHSVHQYVAALSP